MSSGVVAHVRLSSVPQSDERLPGFRILDDSYDENDESLQGIADAKDVGHEDFDWADGQSAGHPGDAQQGHHSHCAAQLGHDHQPVASAAGPAPVFGGHFADCPSALPLQQNHSEDHQENGAIDQEDEASGADESAVIDRQMALRHPPATLSRWILIVF